MAIVNSCPDASPFWSDACGTDGQLYKTGRKTVAIAGQVYQSGISHRRCTVCAKTITTAASVLSISTTVLNALPSVILTLKRGTEHEGRLVPCGLPPRKLSARRFCTVSEVFTPAIQLPKGVFRHQAFGVDLTGMHKTHRWSPALCRSPSPEPSWKNVD